MGEFAFMKAIEPHMKRIPSFCVQGVNFSDHLKDMQNDIYDFEHLEEVQNTLGGGFHNLRLQ